MTDRINEIWDVPGYATVLDTAWIKLGVESDTHYECLNMCADLTSGSVLDAGCGMGHFFYILKKRGYSEPYTGFDNSVEMLKKARGYFPDDSSKFITGDIYNMEGLPYADTVTCFAVLIHLPEIETPVHELWRHTVKRLIITTRVSDPEPSFLHLRAYSAGVDMPPGKMLHIRGDSRADLMKLFNGLGGSVNERVYDSRTSIFTIDRI